MNMKQIEMPEVKKCNVENCAYNKDSLCHARAITVGDAKQHLCDTMMASDIHTKRQDTAGVGACRSTGCMHNEDFECQADDINVILSGDQALCGTFEEK